MTWCKCSTKTDHTKIKLSDRRSKRQAIFINNERSAHLKTQCDGCWITQSKSADWILTKIDTGLQAIVELKGKDVDHACEQVMATAEALGAAQKLGRRVAGLIVCTQYPRNDTKIQRARREFARKFRGPLHAVTSSSEFILGRIVSFDGPH